MAVEEWLTVDEVARMLGISTSKVRRMMEDRYFCGIKRDGVISVPALFFAEGEPVPSVRGTITLLGDAGFSPTEMIDWLFATDDTLPGRPIDHLRKGSKSEVRRRAQALAM